MCPPRADWHRQSGDSKSPPDGEKPGERGAAPGPRGSAGRGGGGLLHVPRRGLLCLQLVSKTHVVWKPVSPRARDLPVPVTVSGEAPCGPARGIQVPPSAPQGRAGLTTRHILVQKETVPRRHGSQAGPPAEAAWGGEGSRGRRGPRGASQWREPRCSQLSSSGFPETQWKQKFARAGATVARRGRRRCLAGPACGAGLWDGPWGWGGAGSPGPGGPQAVVPKPQDGPEEALSPARGVQRGDSALPGTAVPWEATRGKAAHAACGGDGSGDFRVTCGDEAPFKGPLRCQRADARAARGPSAREGCARSLARVPVGAVALGVLGATGPRWLRR